MSEPEGPKRISIGRVAYVLAPDVAPPPNVATLGSDAEGRVVYGDPDRANSRKHVFLAPGPTGLVGYVRADPPVGYGLPDLLRSAFPDPLPRPEALAVLGILSARHIVLSDGTRLGGSRDVLAAAVAVVAREPAGFAQQAARVPEWALADALRLRQADLTARILAVEWVRSLASPELGYVRTIEPHELVLARGSREPIDVGKGVIIGSSDHSHGDMLTRVVGVDRRDVRVVQATEDRAEGVRHGDPAYFMAIE